MTQPLHDILHQLGMAITAQLEAANDRAVSAEAEHARMRDGLCALLGVEQLAISNIALNEATIVTESSNTKPAIGAIEKVARRRSKTPDQPFLDTLTNEWQSAHALRKAMLAKGVDVAFGTVYKRMAKLTAEFPEMIEAETAPERWRLRTPLIGAKPSARKPAKPKIGDVAKSQRPHLRPVSKSTAAVNDNLPQVFRPKLHHGDCLEVMKQIPDNSVDLILADTPYGTTDLKIDKPIPLDVLWQEYRRIIRKPTGNIVLFGSQPYSTELINAAPDLFCYAMVWDKNSITGFHHAHDKPLKQHEDILVFSFGTNISAKRSKRRATFNPQGVVPIKRKAKGQTKLTFLHGAKRGYPARGGEYIGLTNCPTDILSFSKVKGKKGEKSHPFTKPVALLEYLIQTYSNPEDVVLDNTMGSGSTCIAAINTGRRSIGIEMDEGWFSFASERIEQAVSASSVSEAPAVCRPIHRSDKAEIYQGDCLDVMRQMPSGSVDLVVTSPPYNLALSKRRGMTKSKTSSLWHTAKLADGYRSYHDALPHDEYVDWMRNVLTESWRLLADDGAIFFNHKPRIQKGKLWTPLELNPGLPLRQIVIWDRKSGMNFGKAFFTPSHEWVLIFAKPKFSLKKGVSPKAHDVWTFQPERNNPHPAPFPIDLPKKAIENTNAKVVLDPFMGSGTTGVAAAQLGRKFIGIELDDEYAANAISRIEGEDLSVAA